MYKISELSLTCPLCHYRNDGNLDLIALKRHMDKVDIRCCHCGKLFGVSLQFAPFLVSFQLQHNMDIDIDLYSDQSLMLEKK